VETIAVFFDPSAFAIDGDRPLILPVPSVLREMIRYATRWPIGREVTGREADTTAFFEAMAVVVRRQRVPGRRDLDPYAATAFPCPRRADVAGLRAPGPPSSRHGAVE
jgi:hypothetical protein